MQAALLSKPPKYKIGGLHNQFATSEGAKIMIIKDPQETDMPHHADIISADMYCQPAASPTDTCMLGS